MPPQKTLLNLLLYSWVLVSLFLTSGCMATLQSAMGQSSFDAQTYGTGALIAVLRSPSSTRADALAAARELRNRNLAAIPEEDIMDVITNPELRSQARAEFISILAERNLEQFKDVFLETALNDPYAEVAEAAGTAYFAWAFSPDEQSAFLAQALQNRHANMRTRAAIGLKEFSPLFLDELLEQLEVETSASAALAIAESLSEFNDDRALEALRHLADDVHRPFTPDRHLTGEDRIRAEDVRAFAVRFVESAL
jgi:hypothetical protein